MFAVCLSITPSFTLFPLLLPTLWCFSRSAQSMQFSNHPKEDSVEHVVISREENAGREKLWEYEKWQCNVLGNKMNKHDSCESYILFLCHLIGLALLSLSVQYSIKNNAIVYCLRSEIVIAFPFCLFFCARNVAKTKTIKTLPHQLPRQNNPPQVLFPDSPSLLFGLILSLDRQCSAMRHYYNSVSLCPAYSAGRKSLGGGGGEGQRAGGLGKKKGRGREVDG